MVGHTNQEIGKSSSSRCARSTPTARTDDVSVSGHTVLVRDDAWLLHVAELIERRLPLL
jgi:hypothetical protein